jgi:GTP-binding protein
MKIFIIGQSNVGKSYLFNQLCEKSIAITQNENDTTVDIISCKMGDVILYDTPGIKSAPLYSADLFIYKVRDTGLDSVDYGILKEIYKSSAPIIIVASQLEGLPSGEKYLTSEIQFLKQRLGLGMINASQKPIVAIIGRENSGKSTLMNCILGYERCKVSDIAGTTKDSIIEESREFCFVDTAGYCREKTYMQKLISEKRREILQSCDGVILLLDGETALTRIEKQLILECKMYSKFCTVAINKKDLMGMYSKIAFGHFHFGNFLVSNISAKDGEIRPLMINLRRSYRNSQKIIPTPKINQWFNDRAFKLYCTSNKLAKVKYLFQIGSNPTRFKYFSNKKLHEKCEKFILKEISNSFKLEGVNLAIYCSAK